jgi:two-component system, chemotaxis family, protein-glutamate methylesterase/glutaminase
MPKTRVLVVEDSLTARKHLVEVLNADPECEVAGEAEDGKKAIELCRTLRPDVITLDMMLPVMSGVAVTEYVMAYCPTPILVVSSSLNRGELYKTYDALAAGAVDVFEKPSGKEPDGAWERGFLSSVKITSRIQVITHLRGRLAPGLASPGLPGNVSTSNGSGHKSLVAIGASTGGPAAVVEILRGLPTNFPLPILLVIHIGDPFSAAFAGWLDGLSPVPVRYPSDGEPVPPFGKPGLIMAPAGFHLVVQQGRLRLTQGPERHSCRPSVDVLFESIASACGAQTAACLLTGMGRDGAAGLLLLRHAGALTIAQDEVSSVVFGMPREAIQLGAANRVLALSEIAPALVAIGRDAEKALGKKS